MSYTNPPPPQEVNVSRGSPLAEFLRLVAGLALVGLALSVLLYVAGGTLARWVPFGMERGWVGEQVLGVEDGRVPGEAGVRVQRYLQALTDRLAAEMELPEGMHLRVHYLDQPAPNAFASLGGQIAVTRGLYERMDSENALALVIAHEIGHIKARDPIASLGGSATLLVVMALLTGDASGLSTAFASVVQRGYSRRAERRADGEAIEALRRVYGHAGGGASVFETFARYREARRRPEGPSLLSTHPLDDERIERLRQAAADWDEPQYPLVPLGPADP